MDLLNKLFDKEYYLKPFRLKKQPELKMQGSSYWVGAANSSYVTTTVTGGGGGVTLAPPITSTYVGTTPYTSHTTSHATFYYDYLYEQFKLKLKSEDVEIV